MMSFLALHPREFFNCKVTEGAVGNFLTIGRNILTKSIFGVAIVKYRTKLKIPRKESVVRTCLLKPGLTAIYLFDSILM